jgi:hypothetical protein
LICQTATLATRCASSRSHGIDARDVVPFALHSRGGVNSETSTPYTILGSPQGPRTCVLLQSLPFLRASAHARPIPRNTLHSPSTSFDAMRTCLESSRRVGVGAWSICRLLLGLWRSAGSRALSSLSPVDVVGGVHQEAWTQWYRFGHEPDGFCTCCLELVP